ncbi:DNA-directed RNA polymerase subunit beta [bacterium AB1]|nr:DNA-directed RNA polymerase subunit beta [bacterium AB1]
MLKKNNNLNNEDLNIDFNLSRSSYNDFFQFFVENPDPNVGLYAYLKKYLEIEDKSRNLKVYCKNYCVDKNIYYEQLYLDKFMSYIGKISITITIVLDDKEYDTVFFVNYVPIMINNSYFVINGTKKVMIYQLVKTGGIYYELDSHNMMNIIRIVSSSGSRVEVKINQREIMNIYVNSSKKILLPEFFSLINHDKLLRYIKYFKEDAVDLFNALENSILKNVLLFANLFDVKIDKSQFKIYCSQDQIENFLFFACDKNNYEYNIEESCIVTDIENVINCFYMSSSILKIKYKKANVISISQGMIIDEKNKKKIKSLSFTSSVFKVVFFPINQEIINRCFLSFFDNNSEDLSLQDENIESKEDDEDCEEEDDDELSSSSSSSSSDFDSDFDSIEDNAIGVEYIIDDVIRSRINNVLDIKYSVDSTKFTEEDMIAMFIHLSKQVKSVNNRKQNYDYLTYKKIKKPEDFVSNIILRKINRLRSNIKYVNIDKNNKSNIEDFLTSYATTNEIRKIFTSHPLVQFLDQSNPVSEFSHRRRVSVFNLINTEKYQISFEGRDINPTYFGRICPIQTPEGVNIGLINSLSIYAQINSYGFIVSPHYIVRNGLLTNEIEFLSSEQEYDKFIASFCEDFDSLTTVEVRNEEEIITVDRNQVTHMDYSRRNILSVAACLIPAIERNDARRSLMGSNMQRQSTPPCLVEAPVVGTGIEYIPSIMHKHTIVAHEDCQVLYSCGKFVILSSINDVEKSPYIYNVQKYIKTNMKTCDTQVVRVKNGQIVKKGDIIIDCVASDYGKISIGQNILVAFLSWYGYGFEDSIVVSSLLVMHSKFENVFLNDIDVRAKELDSTKEQITIDNPNELVKLLDHLDNRGIIKVGSYVLPFRILVSKVVPIENDSSFEDNVLSIIFGKKVSSYKDISAKASCDLKGTVISAKYISRAKNSNDDFKSSFQNEYYVTLKKYVISIITNLYNKQAISKSLLNSIQNNIEEKPETELHQILNNLLIHITSESDRKFVLNSIAKYNSMLSNYMQIYGLYKNQNMENNVTEYVKITLARRRSLFVGDKLAGRHGNKGVVSCIAPVEDMPYMEDGTPIDMMLNPLGIPNRLNVGQVLETYLGMTSYMLTKNVSYCLKVNDVEKAKDYISRFLKYKIIYKNHNEEEILNIISKGKYVLLNASSFNSISFSEIKALLKEIGDDNQGTYSLFDGKTGYKFSRKVHVGLKYFMKLNHMSEDKVTARETGGYSAILQQPLARKVNSGGQRVGEMEALAIEGHGASRVLGEISGPKSDDRESGNNLYRNIFERNYKYTIFLPETINVIIAYLHGVSIVIDLVVYRKKKKV